MLLNDKSFSNSGSVTAAYEGATFLFKSAIIASSMTVTNLNMPPASTGASIWTSVTVDSITRKVQTITTYTGTTVIPCTPTVTITALTKNDVSGPSTYNIQWTSTCDFPRYSTILIRPAAYLSAITVVSSNLISAVSTMTGPYSVLGSGNYIQIQNFDYVPAGTVQIQVSISATYTAGSSTGDFKVNHNLLVLAQASPATALVTIAAPTGLDVVRYRTYVPRFKSAFINSAGYLSFIFKASQAIAATDYLTIY